MLYKINGLPIGWFWAPSIVLGWLKQLKIRGEKIGNKVRFKIEDVKAGLESLKVPHIAEVLENKDLEFEETNCVEEKNN